MKLRAHAESYAPGPFHLREKLQAEGDGWAFAMGRKADTLTDGELQECAEAILRRFCKRVNDSTGCEGLSLAIVRVPD